MVHYTFASSSNPLSTMKKINTCILVLVSLLTMASCAPKAGTHKNLVVYYSQTGSTQMVADLLATSLNADMLCLQCETPYPDTFEATIEESRDEVKNNTGRALTNGTIADLNLVDTVFIGFPIWWNTAPRIINTFIEANPALAGKTVAFFATSGGSNLENSDQVFKAQYTDLNWQNGMLMNDVADSTITCWLGTLGL